MLYPSNLEAKLGFDKIRELLKDECQGPVGQEYVEKMRFSTDFESINRWIEQTAELKNLISSNLDFSIYSYVDIEPFLKKASLVGAFLDEEELFAIRKILSQSQTLVNFFRGDEENHYPALKEMSSAIEVDKNLLKRIDQVIDGNGRMKDDASHELMDIRRNIVSELSRLRKTLNSLLSQAISKGYIDDEANITIRNGRLVIPILAEYKRKFKGFIHDESATGQTVYLEPEEVLEINNYVKELEYAEKREIARILTFITDHLREYLPNLRKTIKFTGQVDFIQAKARFALKVKGNQPILEKKASLKLESAIHPLLYLFHQKQGKPVMPLTVALSEEPNRVLVISGPNAGGKSVLLKTVGLLQYMHQCGLLVSAGDGSSMGIFEDIFIDIGDEQSLENDLSTYSSHLQNMRHFLAHSGKKSLILIDEFGTGTDPLYGGAIAEAILEKLHQKRVFGIVNTHYTNLKNMAEKTQGMVNGAMRFDPFNLEPLYQLEVGKPGSSFALEIAEKIGLPKDVIEKSKEYVGKKQVNVDFTLRELQKQVEEYDKKNRDLAAKEKALKDAQLQYEELSEYMSSSKKKLLNEAKQEAQGILKDANQLIEKTIREIKENKAEKESTKQVREELQNYTKKIKPEKLSQKPEIVAVKGELKVGDFVRVKDNDTIGELVAIRGKDVEILVGEMKLNMKLARLEKIAKKDFVSRAGKKETREATGGVDLAEKRSHFAYNIDLRGKRGEDALVEIRNVLDDAILLGVPEFRIVHGKGDGILRQLIREELKRFKKQFSYSDEHADRGGDGVTIVKMN